MAKDSIPELELANVRTRERLTDSVSEIRRRSDVPARTPGEGALKPLADAPGEYVRVRSS